MDNNVKNFILENNNSNEGKTSIVDFIEKSDKWNEIIYHKEYFGWIILIPFKDFYTLHIYILKEFRRQHFGRHLVNLFLPKIESIVNYH